MKEVVLLPLGEQSHIDALLSRLAGMVEAGREGEFALLLPSAQLLHQYRHRLVCTAARQLHLTTFDELAAEALAAAGLKITEVDGCTATEIIARILEDQAGVLPRLGRYAGSRAMARELAYALSQMRRSMLTPGQLKAALVQNPDPLLGDVLRVWEEYLAFMHSRGAADLEEQYLLAAPHLAEIPWLKEVRELHLCWFFDFEPLQMNILDNLPGELAVTVWMPFMHPAHAPYIEETVQALASRGYAVSRRAGPVSPLAANLFCTPSRPCPAPRVRGLAAPRLGQELELIAREIKRLAAAGTEPGEICLVVPEPRLYLPRLRQVFQEHGIEVAVPMVTDLTAVPWVREILSLWRAAASGWDRNGLVHLAASAYITAHLPPDYDGDAVAQAVASLSGPIRGQEWLLRMDRELERLNRQLEEDAEPGARQRAEALMSLYRAARAGTEAWLRGMEALTRSLSPREHCQFLQNLLEQNAHRIAPAGEDAEAVRDRAALDKFRRAIEDYLACCRLLKRTAPVAAGRFIDDFAPWLERDLALERSNPGAVQILAPSQVRGLKFKNVFFPGLNQDVFPRPDRGHWLLDRVAQRTGVVLSRASALVRDKIFFHTCVAAVEDCLYISRLLPGVGQEAGPSPFWRDVEAVAEGMELTTLASSDLLPPPEPVAITSARRLRQSLVYALAQNQEVPEAAEAWLRAGEGYSDLHMASSIEQRRESPLPPDNMDGVLARNAGILAADPAGAVYSISRLEQYARCPFSFFARYCLELEPALQDVPDYSALERGTLLHWPLEKYYAEFFVPAGHRGAEIRDVLEMLAEQWLHKYGRDRQNRMWQLRVRDAVDMVQALVESDLQWLERTGLRPVLLEASFGLPGSAVPAVRPGGGPVSFRGKIDRIDVVEKDGETWAVVYDYKTSQPVTKKDILAGRSLQIPVYMAAAPALLGRLGYTNVRVMGGGYYVIKKGKLEGGIWHKEFTVWSKKGLGALEADEFQVLEQNLAQRAAELHRDITAGRFPPQPSPGACTYCEYRRCCRYDKNRLGLKKGVESNAAQS